MNPILIFSIIGAGLALIKRKAKTTPEAPAPEPDKTAPEPKKKPAPNKTPREKTKLKPVVDKNKTTQRIAQIYKAMTPTQPATVRNTIRAQSMFLDKSVGIYKPTGGSFDIPAGTKFFRSNIIGSSPTTWVIKTTVILKQNVDGYYKPKGERLMLLQGNDFEKIYV
tara:strand:+ start:5906 stop:6403 length:498 start_codon:yes stop_codon:yes gene_type:complete